MAAVEAVRKKVGVMKEEVELAEEKAKELEMHLRFADQRLEGAMNEKDSLIRKLKLTEASIEKSEKLYQESLQKLQDFETAIDISESKRKALEQKELSGDDQLTMLEQRLRDMKVNLDERNQLLEEAKRRREVLTEDLRKTKERHQEAKEKAEYFEGEIEVAGERLRDLERREVNASSKEYEMEDEVRYLEDQLRQSQEKWFIVHDRYKSLERIKEQMEGKKKLYDV